MQSRLKLDPEDDWLLREFSWHMHSNGYAVRSVPGRSIYMHRQILNPRENECVDHINGDKLDNRKSNLRIAPHYVNQPPYKGRKFKGVYKCWNKFRAYIRHNKAQYYLGLFDTEEEAAKAVNAKARELEVPFFRFNKVD